MPENEAIVLPVSGNCRRSISEAEARTGLERGKLMSALVHWFVEQDPAVQQAILRSDRPGGSDLAQVLIEWTDMADSDAAARNP